MQGEGGWNPWRLRQEKLGHVGQTKEVCPEIGRMQIQVFLRNTHISADGRDVRSKGLKLCGVTGGLLVELGLQYLELGKCL